MAGTHWLRMSLVALMACMVLGNAPLSAQPPPPGAAAPQDADQRLVENIRQILRKGRDLYNTGDRNGSYHLFEGALLGLKTRFEDRPQLQKTIDDGLSSVEQEPSVAKRAFALRDVLLQVENAVKTRAQAAAGAPTPIRFRNLNESPAPSGEPTPPKPSTIAPATPPAPAPLASTPPSPGPRKAEASPITPPATPRTSPPLPPAPPKSSTVSSTPPTGSGGGAASPSASLSSRSTLWDRLGGEKGVRKIVDDFVKIASADPKVDVTRHGKYKLDDQSLAHFKEQMTDYVSSVTGGPLKYTGENMKAAHKDMGITNAQFDAAAADLRQALQQNGIKPTDIDQLLQKVDGLRKDIVTATNPAAVKPDQKDPVKP